MGDKTYSELVVRLGELNRLLVFFVLSEDQSRNSSEFFIVVTFNFLGESKGVNALEPGDGVSQGVEVFDLEVEGVQSIVDSLVVAVLDTLEPLHNDWKISSLFHLKRL